MERINVPFLKYGGRVRELSTAEDKRPYENDRQRVKKVKKMIAMGQSQLLMPPQHRNQNYCQNEDQSRSGSRDWSNNTMSDSYVLAGSEFLEQKAKPYLTPPESRRAKKELREALKSDMFRVWPVYDEGEGADKAGKQKTTANEKLDNSGVLVGGIKGLEQQRRGDIEGVWEAKEERDIAGRARVSGGYEDVLETEALRSLDGFAPTLLGVRVEDYQRGQDTDEEDDGEQWSMVRRREQMEPVTRRGNGEKPGCNMKHVAGKNGIASNDAHAKSNSRSAISAPKDVATKPKPKAEQHDDNSNKPGSAPRRIYKSSFARRNRSS